MDTLRNKRDRITALTREAKEEQVSGATSRRETDLHTRVHGWRGNDLVVVVIPADASLESVLRTARIVAVGFGCDTLAVTAEAYRSLREDNINPRTGELWQPGEMQQEVEQYGGLESGLIVESLLTTIVNRAGDINAVADNFQIRHNGSGYAIDWIPTGSDEIKMEPGKGYGMAAHLVKCMTEPAADVLMAASLGGSPAAAYGLTGEEARVHMDCAMVKLLDRSRFEGVVMLLADSEKSRAIIRESLGDRFGDGKPPYRHHHP